MSEIEAINSTLTSVVVGSNGAATPRYLVSEDHGAVAGDYRIYATSQSPLEASKSLFYNDFNSSDDVELVNGTLKINETAESNNFTIRTIAILNVSANNLKVNNVLNQSGNLTIVNDSNISSANTIINIPNLTIDSVSSLYAKNFDLNNSETRVFTMTQKAPMTTGVLLS